MEFHAHGEICFEFGVISGAIEREAGVGGMELDLGIFEIAAKCDFGETHRLRLHIADNRHVIDGEADFERQFYRERAGKIAGADREIEWVARQQVQARMRQQPDSIGKISCDLGGNGEELVLG